jgi:hypothetical protein
VNGVERLEHFAIMSGLAPQSVDAIRFETILWGTAGNLRCPTWMLGLALLGVSGPGPPLADCHLQHGGGQAALCVASPTWCRAQVRCPEPAHAG